MISEATHEAAAWHIVRLVSSTPFMFDLLHHTGKDCVTVALRVGSVWVNA